MLESDGIDCVIRNEDTARFAGIGNPLLSGQALGFAWPELWVPDDQCEEAMEKVEAFRQMHEKTLEEDGNTDIKPDLGTDA